MKKLGIITSTIMIILGMTGCIKRDNLEDITIYTTVYPIEYITEQLYGEHSTIKSIYPDGVNINTYELTGKQIKDYSKENMYIFDGLSTEKDYVKDMFNFNKNLMIIDTTLSMEMNYGREELWLDPSNFLMLTLNIKNGLLEYISNHYLKEEIEENYDALKLTVSNIDANLKRLSETADYKTIVVDNDIFKFLEKYGFTVISLEENDKLIDKTIVESTNLLNEGKNHYIFTTNSNDLNETVQKIINDTDAKVLELNTISNLNEKQRNEKEDYVSLLNENIEQLKQELYD